MVPGPGTVLAWLVLVLTWQTGVVRCLQCYSCHYNSSLASCENFSPQEAWVVTCPSSSQTCLVTRGHFQAVTLVTRECGGPASPVRGCRTRELGGGATASICSCSTDLCNLTTAGAGTFNINTNNMALLTVLYFIVNL